MSSWISHLGNLELLDLSSNPLLAMTPEMELLKDQGVAHFNYDPFTGRFFF